MVPPPSARDVASLTPEQQELRRAVAKLVDAEVVPVADEVDARGEFPLALFRRLGALGYFGLRYPERYGGAACDMVTFCLLAEELGRGSMSLAAAAMMQSLMGTHFVFTCGTEAQRERYLVPALRGEKIGTFALNEPGAGSDLSEIRVMTASLSVVLARAAYDAALSYARERVAFGKPIVEHQAIAFKLADMLTGIHGAALMTYDAAAALDGGRPVTREAAMAKLVASETAVRVADEAARIFASYSLATEYPVQRYLRDSRFLLFGGGTSEILRLIIARGL